jgi:hypothetical protein
VKPAPATPAGTLIFTSQAPHNIAPKGTALEEPAVFKILVSPKIWDFCPPPIGGKGLWSAPWSSCFLHFSIFRDFFIIAIILLYLKIWPPPFNPTLVWVGRTQQYPNPPQIQRQSKVIPKMAKIVPPPVVPLWCPCGGPVVKIPIFLITRHHVLRFVY